jgi:hypothetical protein
MRGNPTPNPNPNSNPQTSSSSSNNHPRSNSTPNNPPTTPSLATRIQSSAAGLARSAFQPGSTDTAQTLANSTSSKPAAPSSSSSLSTTHLQTARDLSAPAHSASHGPSSGPQTFREDGDAATGSFALPPLTEEEFQRGTAYDDKSGLLQTDTTTHTTRTNETEPYTHHDLQTTTGPWKGKARAQDPTQLQFETAWQRQHAYNPQQSEQHLDTADGSAVVDLLSDSTFDPNFEDPVTVNDIELDISAAPAPLSAAEVEALDSFRRGLGLGPDGQSVEDGRPARITATSLVPDIDTFLSQEGAGFGIEGTGTATGPTSLRDDVLNRLPGAGDWVGVHERYHDEVWGFLEPVLEAARAEIEEEEQQGQEGIGGGVDGPAVRRLKMILVHMKG